MLPGLEPGQTRSETEAVAALTELAAGLTPEGIWVLVATLEHVARRWMSEFMEPGEQSVGASVCVERVLPAPTSDRITSTATLREVSGRRYVFDVELRSESGR